MLSGPNENETGSDTTDSNGVATFTYTGDGGTGTDQIQACYTNDANQQICSLTVTKVWNISETTYDISLTPVSALNLVGETHTLTATITSDGSVEGISVTFTVLSGPNAGVIGTDTTNAGGEATIGYTGSGVGTDNIQASFVQNEETIYSNVVEKEWTEEVISLSPLLAQNQLNTDHTVTATVEDLKGNAIDNKLVTFQVISGPNDHESGSDTTDSNGEVTFIYTGDGGGGTDIIQACFDNAAGDTVCTDDNLDIGDDAVKEWGSPCPSVVPQPQELPEGAVNQPYSEQLTGFGGESPYTFLVTAGNLPSGLSLDSDGLLSGTPDHMDSYTFTVTVTDNNGCQGTREYTIDIAAPIPTANEWGMIVLALGLAAISFTVIGRRRLTP